MNTQIYEEATQWLIKHREAGLSTRDKGAFDTWLRESPQHVRAYLEMSAVWEDVPALDPNWNPIPDQLIARACSEGNIYPLADAARISAEALSPEHSSKRVPGGEDLLYPLQITGEDSDPRGGKNRVSTRLSVREEWFAVKFSTLAATFLVAIVGVTSWYWLNRNTYVTDIGERRSITLADGSTVELNSRSRVRIRYTYAQRDVDLLEGQALFRVAHNTVRPFVVHSGTASVRAVGTQFDVYKKRAGTVVTVVEGKVAVLASSLSSLWQTERAAGRGGGASSGAVVGTATSDLPIPPRVTSTTLRAASKIDGSNEVFLAAGEQLTVPAVKPLRAGNSSAADTSQHANVAAATAWTHGTLVFESSPLTEVADEFNRYNSRQLVITDAELAKIRVNGMFSSVDPALLLKFLYTQPELDVEETETEIRISKR